MRKFLIAAGAAAGLLAAAGLGFLNMVMSAYADCVYIDPNRAERNVVLFGRVEQVREQDDWIAIDFKLCGSGPAGIAVVKVLTPAGDARAGLVDIGEEAEYRGKPVFHWKKQDMAVVREFVVPGRFLALRPEETPSQPAAEFLVHLKRKNLIALAVDLGLGRAVVYSREFDRVATPADFHRLARRLAL